MLGRVPKRASGAFAKKWADLLNEAMVAGTELAWARFFQLQGRPAGPLSWWKAHLATGKHGGDRVGQTGGVDTVGAAGVQAQGAPSLVFQGASAAEQAVKFLRMGDVKKALQALNSSPIAPKTEATFKLLQALHPEGPVPPPVLASFLH